MVSFHLLTVSITHDVSLTDALFGLLAISIVSNDESISEIVITELEKCQTYPTLHVPTNLLMNTLLYRNGEGECHRHMF